MKNNPASSGDSGDYKEEFNQRFWLKILSSPTVLAPFVIGCSSFMANWALDLRSGAAVFAGIGALLVSAGIFATKLLTSGGEIGQEVAQEISADIKESQTAALDKLEKDLESDGDKRTETALRDLRKLTEAFASSALWPEEVNSSSRAEIMNNVSRLFDSCVNLLGKTLELWKVAAQISVKAAREPILERREKMLKDVNSGLRKLGDVLAGLHEISASENGGDEEVKRISRELEDSLTVARAAEKRMAVIEKEIGGGDYE